jgi:hypothetical protein
MAALDISADNLSVKPEVLVASGTAGATSSPFVVPEGAHATVIASGLAGVEEVNVQAQLNDGTWVTVLDGSFPLLATANASAIWAKGVYRVIQDATAGATTTQLFGISFKRKGY